jgi:hypothetical protein
MPSHSILLYGQSLLLALVAGSLTDSPNLQIKQVATWDEASRLLAEQIPDALIFDLASDRESHLLPLLLRKPDLLLLGLDTECNQAVLLSGKGTRRLTMNEIEALMVNQGE